VGVDRKTALVPTRFSGGHNPRPLIINTDQHSNPPIRGMTKKLTYKYGPRGEGLMIFNFGGCEWNEKDELKIEAKGACGYAITEYDRICNTKKKMMGSRRSWALPYVLI
jgi:hypothetical protein